LDSRKGLCVVSGEIRPLAETHPQKVRNNGDKAKLISSNDGKRTEQDKEKQAGFTFRGRFTTADQAAPIASEISEKAHHALRWLIRKQGYLRDGLAVVSWTTEGAATPRVAASTFELDAESGSAFVGNDLADTDQAFAERLRRSIAGYSAKLNPTQDVLLLALDSAAANQGRLAITYERTLLGSEFLARIARWHGSAAWHQRYEKGLRFVGAPAPDDVAEAAYGEKVKDTHRKQIITRLLPCIVDGAPVPSDLVAALRRRAASPTSFKSDKRWQWIKCLGIACAMFKAQHPERRYQLTLEEARSGRDYLFGRLLAVADSLERIALGLTKEGRDTNATRLMQRFADRPSSTWRTIELSLQPYRMKLRASRGGALTRRDKELKVIFDLFQDGDFESDAPLSAEFLLGYHRQLSKLARKPGDTQNPNQDEGAGDADADEED
jgi:CRISPR-associated protein Csd1